MTQYNHTARHGGVDASLLDASYLPPMNCWPEAPLGGSGGGGGGSVGVQSGQNFPLCAFGAHGASGAFGAHGLLRAAPLATNCRPETRRGVWGGRGVFCVLGSVEHPSPPPHGCKAIINLHVIYPHTPLKLNSQVALSRFL